MSKSKKSVSEKQLAANRANAAKSTGPRTPEGKARSCPKRPQARLCRPQVHHLSCRKPEELGALRADLIATYRPVNSQELFAIERMAMAQWSILRAARMEAGFFTVCLNETCLTTMPTRSGSPSTRSSPRTPDPAFPKPKISALAKVFSTWRSRRTVAPCSCAIRAGGAPIPPRTGGIRTPESATQ